MADYTIFNLNPKRLTTILHNRGVLTVGKVIELQSVGRLRTYPTLGEATVLELTYSPNANSDAPQRILLQEPYTHTRFPSDDREVAFYKYVVKHNPTLPIPFCYHVLLDEDSGFWHILLEELSHTHNNRGWQAPPPEIDNWYKIIDCLARVHASVWGNTKGLNEHLTKPITDHLLETKEKVENHFTRFVDIAGTGLIDTQRKMFETILESDIYDQRIERVNQPSLLTLLHGNSRVSNYMIPKQSNYEVLLVNWHLWTVGICTDDLVVMLPSEYYRRYSRTVETHILKHYHTMLTNYGVPNYSLDDLWIDYKQSIALKLLNLTLGFQSEDRLWFQWASLENLTGSYIDLEIHELIS